jgi:dihydrofolate reductase
MGINLIAAMTRKRVIGKNNALLWHIPDDLKNFKKITESHPVIMGRKTFESIGRPLPNRTNFVVSRSTISPEGVIACSSVEDALEKAKRINSTVFVIGGAQIYAQTIALADKLFISYVKNNFEGDAFFPMFDENDFVIEEKKDFDDFEFVVYKRKTPKK